MLNEAERGQIVEALRVWAESQPDETVFEFVGTGTTWTPQELVDEVASGTPDGENFLEIIEHGVRLDGIKSVTGRFMRRRFAQAH